MPKRNVYVSEELDALINEHEGPVPLATIMASAIENYIGTKACPTCGQAVSVKKVKAPAKQSSTKIEAVENPHTIVAMRKMDWKELKAYAREIDDGSINLDTRKRSELIDSIVTSTGQSK